MALVDVHALKLRYCALEKEALAALTPTILCEAFPNWNARCETFPYWLNRVPVFNAEEGAADDYGDEGAHYIYTLNAQLVVAHATSDLTTESDDLLDFLVPQVIEYFDSRAHLQSAAYPDALLYLRRASFVTGGYTEFPGMDAVKKVGATFQFRNEFVQPIEQAYL